MCGLSNTRGQYHLLPRLRWLLSSSFPPAWRQCMGCLCKGRRRAAGYPKCKLTGTQRERAPPCRVQACPVCGWGSIKRAGIAATWKLGGSLLPVCLSLDSVCLSTKWECPSRRMNWDEIRSSIQKPPAQHQTPHSLCLPPALSSVPKKYLIWPSWGSSVVEH